MLTEDEFNKYYDELDQTDIPVAVAMPNKAKRREYSAPTKKTIASMKYTRARLDQVMAV